MLEEFRAKIPDGLGTRVFTETTLPQAFPLDDPRKADITLGQLLCMTACYRGEDQTPLSPNRTPPATTGSPFPEVPFRKVRPRRR